MAYDNNKCYFSEEDKKGYSRCTCKKEFWDKRKKKEPKFKKGQVCYCKINETYGVVKIKYIETVTEAYSYYSYARTEYERMCETTMGYIKAKDHFLFF